VKRWNHSAGEAGETQHQVTTTASLQQIHGQLNDLTLLIPHAPLQSARVHGLASPRHDAPSKPLLRILSHEDVVSLSKHFIDFGLNR
jgi:hypothetical protein